MGSVVNGLFTKALAVGRYVILLRTAGDLFAHQRFDIEMTTGGVQIPKSGLVQLQPTFGTMIIAGTPREATVVIAGDPRPVRGTFREERRVGTYSVIVEAPGYISSTPQRVVIVPGEATRVEYALERNAGSISLTGAPRGAAVFIDGTEAGKLPVTIANVDTGDHLVEVRAPGHHQSKQMASVRRGELAVIDAQLKTKLARLRVEAIAKVNGADVPVEADILFDEQKISSTPWKGDVIAEIPHVIELRLGNQRSDRIAVNIREGREHLELIEVPADWGGANSKLRFNLIPGPWEIRSGDAVFKTDGTNPVRAGRVQVDFLLESKMVGSATFTISPNEERVVVVTDRPRTSTEGSRGGRS